MTTKIIEFGAEARNKMKLGVDTLANAVDCDNPLLLEANEVLAEFEGFCSSLTWACKSLTVDCKAEDWLFASSAFFLYLMIK